MARPQSRATGAIHATAVAIGSRALLILGPSKSGKSRLARVLIEASCPRRAIRLVGDDRILLAWSDCALIASPHPRIAGFIERRGLGIVAVPFVARARIAGIATFEGGALRESCAQDQGSVYSESLRLVERAKLPTIAVTQRRHDEQSREVLEWWSSNCGAA